jgi:hypothetical protein
MLVDGLCQQFSEVPAHVVDHAPLRLDLAREIPAGVPVHVDEGLQRHPETPRVAKDYAMGRWKPCRPRVEIKTRIESRVLVGPTDLFNPIAAANGPGAATDAVARLEDCDLVAGAAQLVGGDQTCDACPKNDNGTAIPAPAGQAEILRAHRRWNCKPQSLHRKIDGARAAHRTYVFKQPASCDFHAIRPR